jgi:hypothetical protein
LVPRTGRYALTVAAFLRIQITSNPKSAKPPRRHGAAHPRARRRVVEQEPLCREAGDGNAAAFGPLWRRRPGDRETAERIAAHRAQRAEGWHAVVAPHRASPDLQRMKIGILLPRRGNLEFVSR